MHNKYILVMLLMLCAVSIHAQYNDSLQTFRLDTVVITGKSKDMQNNLGSALSVEVAGSDFLEKHFTGNLMQTLEQLPGVHSMNIGSGFAKPAIRGMGFNRILVAENGIKQEGQQWGADHGLEIDAFNIERVVVHKGPVALLYGSDAMGGAIEISRMPPPLDNQLYGEVLLLGKSVNSTWGASLMLGIKKNSWFTKLRYTEQHFGDYRVPTDTIVYLTQRMPIYNNRMKNTAGYERNGSVYSEYRRGRYFSNYTISNAYQKVGFFPGAHGIPDVSRLSDDGNSRNIELPYSTVNHLKITTNQRFMSDVFIGSLDLGYQNNYREERSLFHTHYGSQPVPEMDPDKELGFSLNTFSSSLKLRKIDSDKWSSTIGWDMQYQSNNISGYSFLLPDYNRFTTGLLWLSSYRASRSVTLTGGIRFDYGKVNISAYSDPYLLNYLIEIGYTDNEIDSYRWRSYNVNRSFSDVSGSIGLIWNMDVRRLFKANIGRSFRLPGANELASNGVHHGTFRHEQGDPTLSSEQGWQLDLSYSYADERISFVVSPFFSWFSNYIYLKPTGNWSALPHAGQIYRYSGANTMFIGSEISFGIKLIPELNYNFTGEYVYSVNRDEHIPLSFSPPLSVNNTLTWSKKNISMYASLQTIASQNRVARNENPTPGANLLHAGLKAEIPFAGTGIEVVFTLHNILNTKYYNHLSFYRRVEIPEPGRNFQIFIKIPFKYLLQ